MAELKSGITVGSKVDIMERGKWVGPFEVCALIGRTTDHLILRGTSGTFEQYNDFPYNVRIHFPDQHAVWLGVGHDPSGEQY